MITDAEVQAAEADFKKVLEHLKEEYGRLNLGRANVGLVEGVMIEAYGSKQPLKALASITVPDPRTLQIQPWDRSILSVIEKGLQEAALNLTPQNDGNVVRIVIPALNEERRQELAKLVHKMAEDAKISVRHGRQKAHDQFKVLKEKKEITEDEFYQSDKRLQEKVDEYNKQLDELAKSKESDVMTV